jgi:hypothetical protein
MVGVLFVVVMEEALKSSMFRDGERLEGLCSFLVCAIQVNVDIDVYTYSNDRQLRATTTTVTCAQLFLDWIQGSKY